MLRAILGAVFATNAGRTGLLAVVGLFIFTAVLMPLYNPLTRGTALATASMHNVWAEANVWRIVLHEAVQVDGTWPDNLEALGLPPGQLIEVRSPRPYWLEVNLRDLDILGNQAGKQLLLQLSDKGMSWSCHRGEPPLAERYIPLNCRAPDGLVGQMPGSQAGWYWLVICLLLGVIAALYLLFSHPLILPIQRQPTRIHRLPIDQLGNVDRILRLLGRRQSVLQMAAVLPNQWQKALEYGRTSAGSRALLIVEHLSAQAKLEPGWDLPGQVYRIQFAEDSVAGLDQCLLYEPNPHNSEDALLYQLRRLNAGLDVMLVLLDREMPSVQELAADLTNLLVVLGPSTQTELLLAAKPAEILLQQLTEQLRLTRISPYQTRGGVVRSGAFFGRYQLLGRVLNREPSNYLVVGGRQLGKSSLLKAVQRRLQGHPQVLCHYVSLRDHQLAPRLALQFGLEASCDLEQVIGHVQQQHRGKQVFLLIDEADQFFQDQAKTGYAQLMALRALSEEGQCWFMLAGFWDLYCAAVLDYQSPLRNFGEVLTVGALELGACRELVQLPMAKLRISFAEPELVEQLIQASGQRANLIAIICQECIERLQPGERVISAQLLQQALSSQAVQEALAGWGRLSADPLENRLDRCIVYYLACHGQLRLSELLTLFQQQDISLQLEQVRGALLRLQLAFVIKVDGSRYVFSIPLFRQQFEAGELSQLLRHELDGLALGVE